MDAGHRRAAQARRFFTQGTGALAGVTAALALMAALPASASAACTNVTPAVVFPSCFEAGDGNLTPSNADVIDWSSISSSVRTVADSTADSSTFGGGNSGKLMDPDKWEFVTGSSQQKVDFTASAVKTDPASGDLFFYGAVHRVDGDTTGNANLSFELNQSGTPFVNSVGTSIPRRTYGDIMITFDGGTVPKIGLCYWYGTPRGLSENPAFGWYLGAPPADPTATPTAAKYDKDGCAVLTPALGALGAVNADTLSNVNPKILTDFPDQLIASSFGEIAVNLSKVLATPGRNPCINYGSIWLHSRSSDSDTANMADFIPPDTLVGARTCGLSVDKTVAVNGGAYHEGTPADPSYANNGDTLNYALKVTNTGLETIDLTDISDPNCGTTTIANADKRAAGGGADASPTTFDAGDMWTYRCTHVLAPDDPEPYVNTVTVTGTVGVAPNLATFTGTDSAATGRFGRIIIKKDQTGGSNAQTFAFTAPAALGGNFSHSEAAGDKVFANIVPSATVYTISENALPGGSEYERGNVVCSAGGTPDNAAHSAAITVGAGAIVTCTFRNTRTTLVVDKQVMNPNGGTAVPGNFTMNVAGAGASLTSFPGTAAGTTVILYPVANAGAYNVTESGGPAGYIGAFSPGCSGTPVPGSASTCTVTNTDSPAVLNVVKVVNNNGLGANVPGDFTIKASGNNATPTSFPGNANGTIVTLGAGPYAVTEDPVAGWTTTYSAGCTGTIAVGDSKSCTVTNTRRVGTLEVVKSLFPANDTGTFNLLQDASVKTAAPVGDGGTTGVVIVPAGNHTVGETAGPGASLGDYVSGIDCRKAGVSIASSAGAGPLAVAVGDGDAVRCTVRNERKPRLTVTKVVDNNGLGANVPGDFTINASGTNASPTSFPGSGAGTKVNLDAGPYAVTEPAVPGWRTTYSADCNGTIANGDQKACTVTNTRKVGTLEVVKSLIPADDAGRFNLLQDGGVKTGAPVGDGGTTGAVIVPAGDHTVGETAGPGVSLGDYVSSIGCVKSGANVASSAGSGPLTVAVNDGDAVRCTVSNTRKATVIIEKVTDPAGGTTAFPFGSTLPGGDFALKHGEARTTSIAPGAATVTEADPRPAGYRLDGLVCAESKATNTTTDLGARRASIVADAGETVRCVFRNTLIDGRALVVKSGPATAYHGDDVTYSFVVNAVGNSALSNVVVKDDRCAPVSSTPVSRANDDGDALLEPVGSDGSTPERWTYTCTTKVAAHAANEVDPVINTVTVTAVNEAGAPVSATAQHSTDLLHAGIALTKSGPAAAVIGGNPIAWVLTVSNTGDTRIPKASVAIVDPRCSQTPVLSGVNGDGSPDTLDPGDRWSYTCSTPTSATGTATTVTNTATVNAADFNGRKVTADAQAAATVVYAATAALSRVLACPANGPRSQTLRVTGRNISSVTFTVNGKLVRRVTKPTRTLKDGRSVYSATFRTGVQKGRFRAVATIRYRPATGRRPTRLTTSWNFSCLTPVG